MTILLEIGTLILLFVVPGWAAWLAWGRQTPHETTDLEPLFIIIAASVSIVSLPALLLAEFGLFSLPRLLLSVGILTLILAGWGIYRHGLSPLFPRLRITPLTALALLLLLPLIWQGQQPFNYIVGGRDHGIYINTGIHIARSGSVLITDPELATVPAETQALLTNTNVSIERPGLPGPWSQGQRMPGLTIRSLEDGIILPQGFHLYSVWIAIFYAVGGLDTALATTAVFGVLGALAFYVAAAHLLGRPAALIGLLFLSGSIIQSWFVRYPSAEIMLQFLFWSGLLTFILMLQNDDRFMAVIAAGSLGLMHLTKLDTVVIPVAVLVLLLYLWLTDRFPRSARYFLGLYSLLLLHTLLHAFFIATIYFLDQATRELLPGFLASRVVNAANGYSQPGIILHRLWQSSGWLALTTLAGIVTAIFVLHRGRRRLGQWLQYGAQFAPVGQVIVVGTLALGIIVTAVATLLDLPHFLRGAQQAFRYMNWYLTPLGFLLALIGLLQLTSSRKTEVNRTTSFAGGLLLASTVLPLFILGGGTAIDHFWAVRRFVPVVAPFFYLCAGYLLWEIVPQQRGRWYRGWLPLGLGIVLLAGTWQQAQPFLNVVEYDTLPQQIEAWSKTIPDEAVVLVEQSDPGGRIALPLWTIYDKTVFLVPVENMAALAPALAQWHADERPILWISTQGTTPPQSDGWAVTYETTYTIATPLVETSRDRLPVRTGEYVFTLDMHRVLPATAVAQRQQVTTLTNTSDAISGVYAPTPLRGLDTRAWTSGQVTAIVPTPLSVERVILMVGNGRPPDVPAAKVDVYWQDTYLETIAITAYRQQVELTIPSKVNWNDPGTLRLEMTPWVPAQTGFNNDGRILGVFLDWIKIVRSEP